MFAGAEFLRNQRPFVLDRALLVISLTVIQWNTLPLRKNSCIRMTRQDRPMPAVLTARRPSTSRQVNQEWCSPQCRKLAWYRRRNGKDLEPAAQQKRAQRLRQRQQNRDQERFVNGPLKPYCNHATILAPEADLPQSVKGRIAAILESETPLERTRPATVKKKIGTLKRLFELAVQRGQLEENPFRYVSKPKVAKGDVHVYRDGEWRVW